jgi:NAD(P)-dependent dehydrogenase (short-subunit alcohol dehydrogenase family)
MNITFSLKDVEEFREISGDVNPLHVDDIYARKTPFGERVVYGVLVLLRAMGALKIEEGLFLKRINVEFTRPAFIGMPYTVKVAGSCEKRITLKVFDGTISILKADLYIEKGEIPVLPFFTDKKVSLLKNPKHLNSSDINKGDIFSGEYAIPQNLWPLLDKLLITWLTPAQLLTIVCSSYIVGMELPGVQALFIGMELDFPIQHPGGGPLSYCVTVTKTDERVGLVEFKSNYTLGDIHVSTGLYKAFLRPDAQSTLKANEMSISSSPKSLNGKTVLIVGGSRGIGASVAANIANCGANTIISYQKCTDDARALEQRYPGKITLLQGDASNLQWCIDAAKSISLKVEKLDSIFLCASPAIKPLRLDINTVDRINRFIDKSVSLITTPLAAFMPLLDESGGKCLIMSSQVVNQPFVDWPHYVAAKFAIEGFIRTIKLQYPAIDYYLLRPPKVLTDQMNTNIGRIGAISPDAIARKIIQILTKGSPLEHLEIVEDFVR